MVAIAAVFQAPGDGRIVSWRQPIALTNWAAGLTLGQLIFFSQAAAMRKNSLYFCSKIRRSKTNCPRWQALWSAHRLLQAAFFLSKSMLAGYDRSSPWKRLNVYVRTSADEPQIVRSGSHVFIALPPEDQAVYLPPFCVKCG